MKRLIYLLTLFTILHANVGGVFHNPGIAGDPLFFEATDFTIEKEELFLNFTEEREKKYCSFKAIYHINGETTQNSISGAFYGEKNSDVQIFGDGKRIETLFSDSMFQKLHNTLLTKETGVKDKELLLSTYDATGFQWKLQSGTAHTLIVQGKTELGLSGEWGLAAFIGSATQARHKLLNPSAGGNESLFTFLFTPISSWKSVGPIQVTVTYPNDLRYLAHTIKSAVPFQELTQREDISLRDETLFKMKRDHFYLTFGEELVPEKYTPQTDIPDSSLFHQQLDSIVDAGSPVVKAPHTMKYATSPKLVEQISDNQMRVQYVIESQHTVAMLFSLKDKPLVFHIGGPKIGIGKERRSDFFIMRYAWESALEYKRYSLLFSLEYDTNYSRYHTAAFTTSFMTPQLLIVPNIGVGIGPLYNRNEHQRALRLKFDTNYGKIGLGATWDWYPENDKWRVSLMGQVTL